MSRLTIDELETLTPDLLGELLRDDIQKASPDVQVIQDLLTVGCPINYRDREGWTALHHSAGYGHLEIVKYLISSGADIYVKTRRGYTPYDIASWETKLSCPELRPK